MFSPFFAKLSNQKLIMLVLRHRGPESNKDNISFLLNVTALQNESIFCPRGRDRVVPRFESACPLLCVSPSATDVILVCRSANSMGKHRPHKKKQVRLRARDGKFEFLCLFIAVER